MSEENQTNGSTEPAEADEAQPGQGSEPEAASAGGQPGIHVLGQYIKDLSFENPLAPGSLSAGEGSPELNVNVNVNAKRISETDVEVELKLEATARRETRPLFITEVTYAGVFQLQNVPSEHLQPIMLIECPRLLFPFARQILADATRQGGFPPLLIDPVDFAALYRQKLEAAAAENVAEA